MEILKLVGVVLLGLALVWVIVTVGAWPLIAIGIFGVILGWFLLRK